ncbi:hypothetical protein AAF712_006491 [Marasmius tenuissimus]|uniref:Uncharacterized protein n=1 Tax=Marasmius tenuissimus TaxID=585030 RepID=A0ABR2ZZG0_9AGAR
MSGKTWDDKTPRERYRTMASWFMGPRGENYGLMMEKVAKITARVCSGRENYFPEDPRFIDTRYMIGSDEYEDGVNDIDGALKECLKGLDKHAVPFFSPRYAGHMSFDVSLPAILGYFAAMVYNQNNVTPEASPYTSSVEYEVGNELCEMLRYNTPTSTTRGDTSGIIGWGHITCGGSIANLEAMWVARNLKYYPLSLYNVMKPGAPLHFISETFKVTLCTNTSKKFFDCSPWELLNLTPSEILSLPERITAQYDISRSMLDEFLDPESVQTVGKDKLDKDQADRGFEMKPSSIMLSGANHYSWPKGAAILGIGKGNVIELRVDDDARLDIGHLKDQLEKHLEEKRPVYAVVAIIGTTEHGSVDPLDQIIQLRDDMQKKGLSFVIHADAAWGGYFASKMVAGVGRAPIPEEKWAFSIPLREHTNKQMLKLRETDSVTIDPHKSGYCPYPAGALCYRDGRMRYLTRWTSPYINTKAGDDIAMGIFGVEGSKPGASPVGVWMSLKVLKPKEGYAHLLGVAMLTAVKMYAHWATMTLDSKSLIVMPFNRLPSEADNLGDDKVREERERIRDKIVSQENAQLETDKDTLEFLQTIGSDLMINAFACNFHIDGKPNEDSVEASFLNQRLFKRLSMTSLRDEINDRPIIIVGTEFTQDKYGEALKTFKRRLSLNAEDGETLSALSNVSMSPWPTANEFLKTIVEDFKEVAEEEIKTCHVRVQKDQKAMHTFVIHGDDSLFFVYVASFNVERYRRQVIVKATLSDSNTLSKLREARKGNQDSIFTLHTGPSVLEKLVGESKWTGNIYEELPGVYDEKKAVLSNVTFDIDRVIVNRSLRRADLNKEYPEQIFFYLFGSNTEYHIDHVLLRGPNIHLSAGQVKLHPDAEQKLPDLSDGTKQLYLTLEDKFERIMQPFNAGHRPRLFRPGTRGLRACVYEWDGDGTLPASASDSGLRCVFKGTLELPDEGGRVFEDYTTLNLPAASEIYITPRSDPPPDVDPLVERIVELFAEKDITWEDDNVVRDIYRKCEAQGASKFEIELGYPAAVKDSSKALSRFLGYGVPEKSLAERLGLSLESPQA